MDTTQTTVKRGNGAKIHRGFEINGHLVTYCATDTNGAGRNGLTVRRVVGQIDCRKCLQIELAGAERAAYAEAAAAAPAAAPAVTTDAGTRPAIYVTVPADHFEAQP